MNFNTATFVGEALAGVAALASTVNQNNQQNSQQPGGPVVVQGVAVPADSKETTVRESVGGTVTKTTKEIKNGIETVTTTITKPGVGTESKITTKPATVPVKKPTRIQNDTGNVQAYYGGGIAVQVDRRKVVRPHEEGRCIVIQLGSAGCCRPQFMGEYEDGVFTDLTADDFYDILDQINGQYRGCCPPFACCGNASRRAAAVARLNRQYAHKKISMRVESRTAVYTNLAADLSGDPNATTVEKKYLIIHQV